eukprot:10233611-Alexandrium_andersonii.AAC.1
MLDAAIELEDTGLQASIRAKLKQLAPPAKAQGVKPLKTQYSQALQFVEQCQAAVAQATKSVESCEAKLKDLKEVMDAREADLASAKKVKSEIFAELSSEEEGVDLTHSQPARSS